MKRIKLLLVALAIGFLLLPAGAWALDIGTNITIYDGASGTSSSYPQYDDWYNTEAEDQEVELNCTPGQEWDLEGFFLKDNILSMVGGYDFDNGVEGYDSGDIFLDIDGSYDPYGGGNYGYEYVIDLDFNAKSYNVYDLSGNSVSLLLPHYSQNYHSSPWRYDSGGTSVTSGTFTYQEGVGNTGFTGDSHNLVSGIDLGFLGHQTEFTSHFTMECGNDNLMGKGVVTPEPTTFLLLGLGFLLMATFGRRKLLARQRLGK
ncbi:MAG: PEP-CTERM sorting domain-containing protein [Deltaproteobacteria bacterium]|nr:PEP-CTERM sorting domain-containing protein [Deltaproteobacteria bacterium]